VRGKVIICLKGVCGVSNVLAEICDHKRREVSAAKAACPLVELQARLTEAPPVRDFTAALRRAPDIGLIAEVKKASPSAGAIRSDVDPVAVARIYDAAGAACISCLTDEKYFQGRLEYLTAIRAAVSIPVLRKDFILDRYQVLEARVAGADAILLIAECLNDCEMRELYFYASELGMESLIEIYEPENLDRVLKLEPALLGVNNRNLKTMEVSLDHSLRLAAQAAAATFFISESGIKSRADVERLKAAGVRGILVGETLMRQGDIAGKVRELTGRG